LSTQALASGGILARRLVDEGLLVRFARLGARDYATSGPTDDVLRTQGLDVAALKAAIHRLVEATRPLDPLPAAGVSPEAHSGRENS
jgi:hypothetical protein